MQQHILEGTCRSSTPNPPTESHPEDISGLEGSVRATPPPTVTGLLGSAQVRMGVLGHHGSPFATIQSPFMGNIIPDIFGVKSTFLCVPSVSYISVMINFMC